MNRLFEKRRILIVLAALLSALVMAPAIKTTVSAAPGKPGDDDTKITVTFYDQEGGSNFGTLVFRPRDLAWKTPEPHRLHPNWTFQYYTHRRGTAEDGTPIYDPVIRNRNRDAPRVSELGDYFESGEGSPRPYGEGFDTEFGKTGNVDVKMTAIPDNMLYALFEKTDSSLSAADSIEKPSDDEDGAPSVTDDLSLLAQKANASSNTPQIYFGGVPFVYTHNGISKKIKVTVRGPVT